MFSQNLIKTIKFLPEVMLALDLRILHKKLYKIFTVQKIRGNFKIRGIFKPQTLWLQEEFYFELLSGQRGF